MNTGDIYEIHHKTKLGMQVLRVVFIRSKYGNGWRIINIDLTQRLEVPVEEIQSARRVGKLEYWFRD